jgi:hypothetical protein
MANQTESPHEADIARRMLKDLPPEENFSGPLYYNGIKVGEAFNVRFTLNFDPGVGVYDFVKQEWNWTKPSGTK